MISSVELKWFNNEEKELRTYCTKEMVSKLKWSPTK
jgi:hypothetical protein